MKRLQQENIPTKWHLFELFVVREMNDELSYFIPCGILDAIGSPDDELEFHQPLNPLAKEFRPSWEDEWAVRQSWESDETSARQSWEDEPKPKKRRRKKRKPPAVVKPKRRKEGSVVWRYAVAAHRDALAELESGSSLCFALPFVASAVHRLLPALTPLVWTLGLLFAFRVDAPSTTENTGARLAVAGVLAWIAAQPLLPDSTLAGLALGAMKLDALLDPRLHVCFVAQTIARLALGPNFILRYFQLLASLACLNRLKPAPF